VSKRTTKVWYPSINLYLTQFHHHVQDPLSNQPQEKESSDSSWPLYSLYLERAEEEDNKLAKLWPKNAESIVIFVRTPHFIFHTALQIRSILPQTGLFSAVIAPLLAVTILDLKQNPQETSNFYLQNMYKAQFLAGSNASLPSTPVEPPPFSAPKYIIWVNALWSLSLCISLTCAMVATLLQHWARLYLRNTRLSRHGPHERARIRAFLADGVRNWRLSWVAEMLPLMIHFSLFLFFAGLAIYLFNANHSVFVPVVCWVGFSLVTYLVISFMPIWRMDSPFYTPITSITKLGWDMEKRVEAFVQGCSVEMDGRILNWLSKALVKESDRVRLLEYMPGFCQSSVTDGYVPNVTNLDKEGKPSTLRQFLQHIWFHDTSHLDRKRQFVIGVKVADAVRIPPLVWDIITDVFPWDVYEVLRSVEMGRSLRSRDGNAQGKIGLLAQCVVAAIISNVRERDERWIALAADQIDKPKDVVQGYLEHGADNVLLANLTHITQQIVSYALGDKVNQEMADPVTYMIPLVTRFEVRDTLLELQHDFLALWESIHPEAPNNKVFRDICARLRDIYNALTKDNPSTAPPASNIDLSGHPSDSIYHIDENSHRHNTTSSPISRPTAGLATVIPSPIPDSIADPASSPDDPPGATQPITPVTVLPDSAPKLLESHIISGDAQDLASPITVIPGNIADNSSRDQFTLSPIPGSVPSADAAQTPSVDIEFDNTLESSSPASTSAPSPVSPRSPFLLDPIVTGTVLHGSHDDTQDLGDSIQMVLSHDTRQLGASDNPA
jgi:Family of unknown function (DUF6535)